MRARLPREDVRTVRMMVSLTAEEHRELLAHCEGWAPSVYLRRAAIAALRQKGSRAAQATGGGTDER